MNRIQAPRLGKSLRALFIFTLVSIPAIAIACGIAPRSDSNQRWSELNQSGEDAYSIGNLPEARSSFEKARSVAEAQHLDLELASTLNDLGIVYRSEKNYAAAETALNRALAIREQRLGSSADCTGVTVDNLAELYFDQGRLNEAEAAYKRALKSAESSGSDQPHLAKVLNNLGAFYYARNQFDTAGPYLERALKAYQETQSRGEPSDAGTRVMRALAEANGEGNKEEDARIADITEALLNIYSMDHRYSKFRQLYVEFVRQKTRGDTSAALNAAHGFEQRADALAHQNQVDEAETMFNRALAAYEAAGKSQSSEAVATQAKYADFQASHK